MTVKELEAKVKMLEERIAELEGVEVDADKDWLWDAEQALTAAESLGGAFSWAECPYKNEEFWDDVHDTLIQIAQEEHK